MASEKDYLENRVKETQNINTRINAIRELISEISTQVESLASDSEANAEAIVELAEIIGGGE